MSVEASRADESTISNSDSRKPEFRIDLAELSTRKRRVPTPLLIWLSGAHYEILRLNRAEEKKYQVLGFLVLSTGTLAFIASWYGLGKGRGFGETLVLSLVLGLAVIVIDRSLIALPLNPPRLPSEVTASLVEPLSGGPRAEMLVRVSGQRWGAPVLLALPANVLRLVPRVLVAVCLSLILAEAVLLLRFEDDVNRRAALIQSDGADVRIDRLKSARDARIDEINDQIAELESGLKGVNIDDLTKQVEDLTLKRDAALSDADLYRSLALQQVNPPPGPAYCETFADSTSECTTDQTALRDALFDESNYRTLAQWESDPPTINQRQCLTMSDGREECSSGQPGQAQNYRTFLDQADAKKRVADDLAANNVSASEGFTKKAEAKDRDSAAIDQQLVAVQATLQEAIAAVDANREKNADDIAKLEEDKTSARAFYNQQITTESELARGGVVPPLLVRIQALERLAQDPDPSTFDVDPTAPGIQEEEAKSCDGSGLGGFWCEVRHWVVPPTPLGGQIAAWRYFFLLFDLMPLLAKFVLSSRRFRPYDELEQILAVYTRMQGLLALDAAASSAGKEYERRAADRQGSRARSGVSFLKAERERRRLRWRRSRPPQAEPAENPFALRDEP